MMNWGKGWLKRFFFFKFRRVSLVSGKTLSFKKIQIVAESFIASFRLLSDIK